jgi:hydrogenase nickel incorporation protein HypA/HybF
MLAPGTILASAEIEIAEPRAVCVCRGCGARREIEELMAQCPECGSGDVSIEGGQELVLQSIELEEPDGK